MHAPNFASLEITPGKTGNWSRGVSTVDLIEIQLHVLGLNDLDSPYEIIAADANADGTISTLDLVVLQGIILQLYSEIQGNTSYRFIPSEYTFQNPENPLQEIFPESIQIIDRQDDNDIDFKAIKIGDVNY